jgi:hypothetical protein
MIVSIAYHDASPPSTQALAGVELLDFASHGGNKIEKVRVAVRAGPKRFFQGSEGSHRTLTKTCTCVRHPSTS